MGCHTWFYKKLELQPTYEEVKENFINRYINENYELCDQILNNSLSKDLKEAYPEFNEEYALQLLDITKRIERIINKNLCKLAVCKRFKYNNDLTKYIENKGFYITNQDLPHDIFRIKKYNNINLFSLEETLNYINNNKNDVILYDNWEEKLIKFWKQYNNGVIKFG